VNFARHRKDSQNLGVYLLETNCNPVDNESYDW